MSFNKLLPGGVPTGSLTQVGQEEIVKLAQTHKQRYKHLLPPSYDPAIIHMRSTGLHRNLLSAKCFMAGLYSTEHYQEINTPAQIFIATHEKEVFFPNRMAHSALIQVSQKGLISAAALPEVVSMKKRLKDLLKVDYLLDSLCPTPQTDLPLYMVRDDFAARLAHNFSLPQFLLALWSELDLLACKELLTEFIGPPEEWMHNMSMALGPAFAVILDNLKQVKMNSCSERMFLYATHDSLLLPFLVFLGLPQLRWPPYAADLSFELFTPTTNNPTVEYKHQYFVRINYLGQPINLKYLLSFCGLAADNDKIVVGIPHLDLMTWEIFEKMFSIFASS